MDVIDPPTDNRIEHVGVVQNERLRRSRRDRRSLGKFTVMRQNGVQNAHPQIWRKTVYLLDRPVYERSPDMNVP